MTGWTPAGTPGRTTWPRRAWLASIAVAATLTLASGCGAATDRDPERGVSAAAVRDPDPGADTELTHPPRSPDSEGTASAAAAPHRLRIPSIGLDEDLIDLRIGDDGTLDDPSDWDDVGWFAAGPRPGAPGPTVFGGHVDSASGPAVFWRVLELVEGDRVEVTDTEGEVHTYRVDGFSDHPKDDFPTRDVFGMGLTDELRLITCTGFFDADAGSYLDNRVVFATAID